MKTQRLEIKQSNLEVLNTQLIELQDQRADKASDLAAVEIDQDDFISQYEECLDEVNGEFMGYCASYILKQVDPTAYRCGLNDYCNNIDVSDLEEYKELEEELEEIEDQIASLEEQIEDVETKINDFEEDEE